MKLQLSCILAALTVLATSLTAKTDLPTGPVPGQFIVKLSGKADLSTMRLSLGGGERLSRLSSLQLSSQLRGAALFDQYVIYRTDRTGATVSMVADRLGLENVESIEPDYYLEFFEFPVDSLFENQWYLHNSGQNYLGVDRIPGFGNDSLLMKSGTPGADIGLANFYQSSPAEKTRVVVAIIDSGVDITHPELAGRFWHNDDEIPGNGIDDDHNGFVDDTLGYDVSGDIFTFFDPVPDNDPTDENGHGTHIAGIVAANEDGRGVVGVAPWVEIMPVKIRPNATVSVSVVGILYAVNAGAHCINISWGTFFESGLLKSALAFARKNNVFVAIASGNTGTNERFFPAGFDFSFVVGAGNSDGFVTSFSTFGSHVDIVAPGLDILSLRAAGTDMFAAGGEPGVRIIGPDSLYFLSDGTSMATPTVVGAAALLRSLRPDLTLDELEEALHLGATDIVDPYDQGDSLVGPDTVSGYGYLNIDASLALLTHGGLAIASPAHRQRYTTDVAVKAAAISGYTGSWQLDYSVGLDSDQWLPLASGASVPADSVLFVFTDSMPDGHIRLRLTDHFDSRAELGFVYVRHNRLEITGPDPGIEIQYNVPIFGRAYGPQYDSMALFFREENGPAVRLKDSQGEFFDSLLTDWTVSGEGVGEFTIYLFGYFGPDVLIDSVPVTVTSAFAAGWPVTVGGRGGISPACADLNNDGTNELIVPTFAGLYVFEPDGTPFEGFPVLPNKDVRCVPAVYDIDRDGMNEIICTSADGIHVFNHDGSHSPGWPREMYTGLIPFGYGYPNPTVTRLGAFEDSAIVIINKIGQILAYEFNGDPYFFSREGLFASFDARIANFQGFGGDNSPFVGSTDLDGDGQYEVVSSYTAPLPYEGLGIFDGRTGLPGLGLADPLVVNIRKVYGMALADLNGDDNPEIIVMGYDSAQIPHIWVKTNGLDDLQGWPVAIPSMEGWIGQYPIMADLDLDGVPEIMTTYFEFDVGALYIFRADGTSYLPRDGRPAGEAFTTTRTVGTPIAANLTGDDLPEIIFRAGHIFPGTGPEEVFILDNQARPLEGWPIVTPARPTSVLSSRMAPMVDDLDGDGLVELIMVSDGSQVLVWDFDASYDNGNNRAKFLQDNLNSAHWLSPRVSTDIDDDPNGLLPGKVRLAQNYPNPFNPATVIGFSVPVRARVQLEVFNILGQRVISLIDRELKAGKHQASFDGGKFASGVYFYRLTVGEEVRTRKMLLIK